MIRIFVLLCALASPVSAETLRLAVTTSFHNSGLADILLPEIAADIGLEVQLLTVGTGQALRLAAAGDVDAVLVHARSAEEAHIAAGHAPHRREIMYNDFILLGPAADPANAASAPTARAALSAIAAAQAPFVSRGDDSGTHKAEQALWSTDPSSFGAWYRSTGSGMGAALNTAVAMDAYILSDRASWLNFGNPGGLVIHIEGDPALFNQYAYLPVSASKGQHINAAGAARLEAWLVSDTAKALINGYKLRGAPLFTWNAQR
ncbi:MAG: substrate-binding domain-containing protein [Pseudomonadota bacterium]